MLLKEIQNRPHFVLIETDETLAQICRRAQEKSAVALDTEFIRIRTYYPKLGLIQLYDGETVSLIVPDEITDFSPFKALLADTTVSKILHACGEDLEVFHHYFNQLPTPMMDTQVMANFLDFSGSAGFAALVHHYFQLELDKGAARTDWLARPLSQKQLNYAAADVWYLLPLYYRMQQKLSDTAWQSAAEHDCNALLLKAQEIKDPDKAYLNIPNAWKLNSEELARLRILAKWRQEEAKERDLAVNFVVKSEALWAIARNNPKSSADMLALGVHPNEVRHHGKKMLRLINQANRLEAEQQPAPIVRISDDPRYKSTVKALQQKLKELTPPELKPEVVASKRSLERLIKWQWIEQGNGSKLPELLTGWRKPLGEQLLNVIKFQQ